jgi:hypothetical protein
MAMSTRLMWPVLGLIVVLGSFVGLPSPRGGAVLAQESPMEFLMQKRRTQTLRRGDRRIEGATRRIRTRIYYDRGPTIYEEDDQTVMRRMLRPSSPFGALREASAPRTSQTPRGRPLRAERPGSGGLAGTSYCVRLCDGYFFPVGQTEGGDAGAHDLVCAARCPNAETRLYVAPPGSDGITGASHRGKPYEALPTAFRFQTAIDKSCACQPTGRGVASLPVLKDFTLRQGDVVMTRAGLRALASVRRYPLREASLVPLERARSLSAAERKSMRVIEDGNRDAELTRRDRARMEEVQRFLDQALPNTYETAAAPGAVGEGLVQRLGDRLPEPD